MRRPLSYVCVRKSQDNEEAPMPIIEGFCTKIGLHTEHLVAIVKGKINSFILFHVASQPKHGSSWTMCTTSVNSTFSPCMMKFGSSAKAGNQFSTFIEQLDLNRPNMLMNVRNHCGHSFRIQSCIAHKVVPLQQTLVALKELEMHSKVPAKIVLRSYKENDGCAYEQCSAYFQRLCP